MSRIAALSALVKVSMPVSEAISNLEPFSWDCERDLIVLNPEDIKHVLSMFVQGEVKASDVEAWANALECREDVGFSSPRLEELLQELANPALTAQLTDQRAREHLVALDTVR